MAEKVNMKPISSTARSSNSGKSKLARPLRVVHISNPKVVRASASEFRAVVQTLTGQKRSSASRDNGSNLRSDQYSPQLKVAKLEDGLQCLTDMKTSQSAFIREEATEFCHDKNHGDVRIFEDLEVNPIQFPDYTPSQYKMFEAHECFEDTRHFIFPSILLSEFEYL